MKTIRNISFGLTKTDIIIMPEFQCMILGIFFDNPGILFSYYFHRVHIDCFKSKSAFQNQSAQFLRIQLITS